MSTDVVPTTYWSSLTFDDVCDQLAHEPLLSMSLGSKELFHSNLLVWYATCFREAAANAFASWTHADAAQQSERHERESRHLDAVLRFRGLAPIVIENKAFSVPTAAQLTAYAQKFNDEQQRAAHVLLTLMPADVSSTGWTVKRYSDLADAIETQFPMHAEGFESAVLEHYVRFLRLLHRLVELVGTLSMDEPLSLSDPLTSRLRELRLDSGLQKARASALAAAIRGELGEAPFEPPTNADIGAGLTNATGLVQFFRPLPTGPVADSPTVVPRATSIGWQLQNNQFRLAVITNGFARGATAAREDYVESHFTSWFSADPGSAATGRELRVQGRRSSRSKFLAYEPDFTYRYIPVHSLPVKDLITLGVAYARAALAWDLRTE